MTHAFCSDAADKARQELTPGERAPSNPCAGRWRTALFRTAPEACRAPPPPPLGVVRHRAAARADRRPQDLRGLPLQPGPRRGAPSVTDRRFAHHRGLNCFACADGVPGPGEQWADSVIDAGLQRGRGGPRQHRLDHPSCASRPSGSSAPVCPSGSYSAVVLPVIRLPRRAPACPPRPGRRRGRQRRPRPASRGGRADRLGPPRRTSTWGGPARPRRAKRPCCARTPGASGPGRAGATPKTPVQVRPAEPWRPSGAGSCPVGPPLQGAVSHAEGWGLDGHLLGVLRKLEAATAAKYRLYKRYGTGSGHTGIHDASGIWLLPRGSGWRAARQGWRTGRVIAVYTVDSRSSRWWSATLRYPQASQAA